MEAYKKAIELDPKNTQYQSFLKHAENLQRDSVKDDENSEIDASNSENSAPTTGNAGGFDMNSLLKNPALANMAKMFGGGGGAAASQGGAGTSSNGGMPDMSSLLNNPQLMNMYVKLFICFN